MEIKIFNTNKPIFEKTVIMKKKVHEKQQENVWKKQTDLKQK